VRKKALVAAAAPQARESTAHREEASSDTIKHAA